MQPPLYPLLYEGGEYESQGYAKVSLKRGKQRCWRRASKEQGDLNIWFMSHSVKSLGFLAVTFLYFSE